MRAPWIFVGALAVASVGWAAPAPAGEATGFLDVTSDPVAKIIIDEADTGKTTPQPHLELKAGHHLLALVSLDGKHKRAFGFSIEPGKTRKFTVHLLEPQ